VSRRPSRLSARARQGKYSRSVSYSPRAPHFSIVVIAADISPIDVLSHLPILCEDKNVPYIYVKSRAEVGEACKTKRPTSCVLINMPSKDLKVKKSFDRCLELVQAKNTYVN